MQGHIMEHACRAVIDDAGLGADMQLYMGRMLFNKRNDPDIGNYHGVDAYLIKICQIFRQSVDL